MPPFHKNSIPTWFVENNQCCLHLNCRKHSVLRQYTTRELRKTISCILSLNLVTKHFIKSLLFIFKFVFYFFFLRVFNLVQFPVLIVPALFLQGTYLEAVSGLHCFIFLARLNMKEQVIIINCCNINFIIILISSEKKQQQHWQNKQTRTSISVSI